MGKLYLRISSIFRVLVSVNCIILETGTVFHIFVTNGQVEKQLEGKSLQIRGRSGSYMASARVLCIPWFNE